MRIMMILACGTFCAAIQAAEVLTVALGDEFYYGTKLEQIEEFYQKIRGSGVNLSWAGNPPSWETGVLEKPEYLQFYRDVADIARANGIGAALGVHAESLLPAAGREKWFGALLDPKTGLRMASKSWDFANPEAMTELARRYEEFMNAVKPREMYFVDEQILISPGNDAHIKRMSAYWTSPTYSQAALESFRKFLSGRNFPNAAQTGFPVTTGMVEPGPKANMGLPAVPISSKNEDYLTPDNNWPDSDLWRAWYDWREELLTELYRVQIVAAEKVFSGNPRWQGVMVSSPTFWFCRETGLSAAKVAAIPELKYLVAGYMNGRNLLTLKPHARKNGKLLGGMIELSIYGNKQSPAPDTVLKNFKYQIENGARLMLLYPLANFNPTRQSEKQHENGMDYRPAQVELWKQCADYLKEQKLAVPPLFPEEQN